MASSWKLREAALRRPIRNKLTRGLVLVMTLAGFSGAALAAVQFPDWATAAVADVDAEQHDGEDAVIALMDWSVEVKKGERSGIYRRVVQILSEEGRDAANVFLANDDFGKYTRVRFWVQDPDGTVRRYSQDDGSFYKLFEPKIYNDTTHWAIGPAAAVPGMAVALEAQFRKSNAMVQDLVPFQFSVPMTRFRYAVKDGGNWTATIRSAALDLDASVEDDGIRVWSAVNIPKLAGTSQVSAPQAPQAILSATFHESGSEPPMSNWNDVARWQLANVDTVAGRDMLPPLEGDDPFAAATARARDLRYFAILLGWGGWLPRKPATTLTRGFGDCKDKAQVIVDLLQQNGQEAYPVLVMARSDGWVCPTSYPAHSISTMQSRQ